MRGQDAHAEADPLLRDLQPALLFCLADMRRFVITGRWGVLVALGVAAVACSGPTGPGGDGGGGGGSSGAGSSGGGTGFGSSGSSSGGSRGGAITCGTAMCSTATDVCCITGGDGGKGFTSTCESAAKCAAAQGMGLQCTGAIADCPTGEVCCLHPDTSWEEAGRSAICGNYSDSTSNCYDGFQLCDPDASTGMPYGCSYPLVCTPGGPGGAGGTLPMNYWTCQSPCPASAPQTGTTCPMDFSPYLPCSYSGQPNPCGASECNCQRGAWSCGPTCVIEAGDGNADATSSDAGDAGGE